MTVERDRAVTLKYGALTVETTSYESFEKLRACINDATKALEVIPSASTITRLGLRYINEIQVPGIKGMVRDWLPYINPSLLSPVDTPPKGFRIGYLRGHLGFHSVGSGEHAYATYGRLPQSSLEADDILQLPAREGPCFLLDIDSWRQGNAKRPVAGSRGELLSVVDRLHDAVEEVFNWSISDTLRNEVLRRSPTPGLQDVESTHA